MSELDLDLGVQDQDGSADPGRAALIAVARYHGIHLSLEQVVRENMLTSEPITTEKLLSCAETAGMRAKAITANWKHLAKLERALPVIVTLQGGGRMVLLRTEGETGDERVVLQDPLGGQDAVLPVDRARFEQAWTGEVVLLRPSLQARDAEAQEFSFSFVLGLMRNERKIVFDLMVSAVILSFLALVPIMFFRILTARVLPYNALNTFVVVCIAFGLLTLFEAAFGYLKGYLVTVLTTRVDIKLTDYAYSRVLRLPVTFFERSQVGMIARDFAEMNRIRVFIAEQLFGVALDLLVLVFFLPIMFYFSVPMTGMVVLVAGLIFGWLWWSLPWYKKISKEVLEAEGERGAFLVQSLQGIRTVKALAMEDRFRREWDRHAAKVARLKRDESSVVNLINAVVRPLERIAVSGSLALGVYLAMTTDDVTLRSSLFVFILLSGRVLTPVISSAQLLKHYEEVRSAVAIVSRLLNQAPEEGHQPNGVRTAINGNVEFVNVRFTYSGAVTPALDDVSFAAPAGSTLGFVGHSGSGKTTVTRLLQWFHSDFGGLIKIDGVDLRQYDVDHLRRSMGVVAQENFLFTGTIRENIMGAKSDATFDDIVRAARLSGAEEFIERLPRGYETFVFEGSPNLSGGQKQRLAIARALILDPKILILDEATSALDPESEAIVNSNIRRIARDRTVIVISHRLSSLVNSDAIVVLKQGKVEAIGRHEELLAKSETYSSLWNQQNAHITHPRRLQVVSGRQHGD